MNCEFPQLKSIRVVVEEQRSGAPGGWRTHEYSGLEAIPQRLRPAFASPGTCPTATEVDLLALLRAAYADGLTLFHHQADYLDGAGCDKAAVRRAISLYLNYKTLARAEGRTAHATCAADGQRKVA